VRSLVNVIIVLLIGVLLIGVTLNMPTFGDPHNPVPSEHSNSAGAETLRWFDIIGALAVGAGAVHGIGLVKQARQGKEAHHG
jgi:flagellar basal body-associated protein FliL